MKSDKFLVDKDKQSSLLADTKYLVQETATTIIEIFEGETISDLEKSGKIQKLKEMMMNPEQSLGTNDEGRRIVECSDAIRLLKEYYASAPYGNDYKNKILDKYRGTDDFSENKFKNEYNKQTQVERDILDQLRTSRNEWVGHAVKTADMGEIYLWIRQLMKYIECFIAYRIQELSKYDERLADPEIRAKLDKHYTKASMLKMKCFAGNTDCKEFRFGKNTYIVYGPDEDKEDFGMLITDMANNWNSGIDYLRENKTNDSFTEFLEESFEDYDIIVKYLALRNQLLESEKKSTKESMIYMDIIYLLYPEISGIYWRGTRYSESYFASLVLQVLTRHPQNYSIEDKVKTLKHRITHSEDWKNPEGSQRGLGINVIDLCSGEVLSKYFKGRGDGEGFNLAIEFEKRILSADQLNDEDDNKWEKYDRIIVSILALTAHMKGKATYMLPVPQNEEQGHSDYRVFEKPEDFRTYFIDYMNSGVNVVEAAEFVRKIRYDTNLKWWIENFEKYETEEK